MSLDEKYWLSIQRYIRKQFGVEPEIYTIIFLIGVRELGYGFIQLDQETKTKVINFASMFLLKYIPEEDKKQLHDPGVDEDYKASRIYRKGIINYFKTNKILE